MKANHTLQSLQLHINRLYTGCRWKELPISRDPVNPEKRNQLTITLLPLVEVECDRMF